MLITVSIDPTQCAESPKVLVAMDKDYADYISPVEFLAAMQTYSDTLKKALSATMATKFGVPVTPEDDVQFLERVKDLKISDLFPIPNKG